jgi:hypothetical protein
MGKELKDQIEILERKLRKWFYQHDVSKGVKKKKRVAAKISRGLQKLERLKSEVSNV